jgi:hypothetical protein
MTDLTPRELVDAITLSLSETWQRMAAKYKGVAADQPAPERPCVHELEKTGGGRRGTSPSNS